MKKGFTLIELLVVVAIISVLAVVVVLTLNPAESFRQSRDSDRVSDMDTLAHALFLYESDQGLNSVVGTASVVYISLPDPSISGATTSTCSSLGLPTLPSGYTYQCSSPQDYKKVNGTGWIPVNFSGMTAGSPVNSLPVDPTNTSSTGLYYTYNTDGISNYEFTSIFESSKFKAQYGESPIDPDYPEVDAKGTSLSLSPLFNPTGLVGYWPLTEGSGTTAYDQSGNGNNGTWSGNTPYYTGGKVGNYAGDFNGSNNYIDAGASTNLNFGTGSFSIAVWINTTQAGYGRIVTKRGGSDSTWYSLLLNYPGSNCFTLETGGASCDTIPVDDGNWHHIVAVDNNTAITYYVDGKNAGTATAASSVNSTADLIMGNYGGSGGYQYYSGLLEDVRIYNRSLSLAEIQALYDAEK